MAIHMQPGHQKSCENESGEIRFGDVEEVLIDMKFKFIKKNNLAYLFFIMSPFFPGNNWLEISLIGAFIGWISPLQPDRLDLGLARAFTYLIYNLIGIVGYFLLREETHTSPKLITCLEVSFAIFLLFITKYIPKPFDTIILTGVAIYFLRYQIKKIILTTKKNKGKRDGKSSFNSTKRMEKKVGRSLFCY